MEPRYPNMTMEYGKMRNDCEAEVKQVTVFQLAVHRGAKMDSEGAINGSEFVRVGLPLLGGCQRCSATIAAYNACPTKNGNLTCLDCIGENEGFETVEEAELIIFALNRVNNDDLEYDSQDYDEDPYAYESEDYYYEPDEC